MTVPFDLSGVAGHGTDYAMVSGYVSFAGMETSKTVSIWPMDDSLYEPTEDVILTLVTNAELYTFGTQNTATVAIEDDEALLAVDDVYSVFPGQTLTVPANGVLGNDTFTPPGVAKAAAFPNSNEGTLTRLDGTPLSHAGADRQFDGGFIFKPKDGFTGDAIFEYQVLSGGTLSTPATVTIHVVNRAPAVTGGTFTVGRGTLGSIGIISATDPDPGQTLDYELIGAPDGDSSAPLFLIDSSGRLSIVGVVPTSMSETTFTVRVLDDQVPKLTADATVTVHFTSFAGSLHVVNFTENYAIKRDPGSAYESISYSSIEYATSVSDPEGPIPVAYKVGDTMTLSVQIKVPYVNNAPDPQTTQAIKIKGSGGGFTFSERDLQATNSGGATTLESGSYSATTAFTAVSFHPNLAIDWQIKIGGGSWFSVGASINYVYVSLASPSVSDQVYRTLVHNGTRDAQGATGSYDVVMGIFNAFKTLHVTTWDGHSLKYLHKPEYAAANYKTYHLLKNKAGPCDLWAQFFADVVGVHAVTGVAIRRITPRAWADGFIVNGMSFTGSGTPYTYPSGYEYIDPQNCRVTGSAPGQGGTPTKQDFNFHDVIEYGALVLDPSYGTEYFGRQAWEDANVAATFEDIIELCPLNETWKSAFSSERV